MKFTADQPAQLLELIQKKTGIKTKTQIKQMIRYGSVLVNGKIVKRADIQINNGDNIEILRKNQQTDIRSGKYKIPIIFEDKWIIAVEKPAGLLTSTVTHQNENSLQKIVGYYLRGVSKANTQAFVIHRLDREVAGIVLFAKNAETQNKLKDNWEKVRKIYYAYVEGNPPKEKDTIESWLMEGADQKMYSTRNKNNAKFAVTEYKLIKKNPDFSLLEINLITGRKNQIRVHLSEIGCPIVGDRRYGADDSFERRIRLFARYISFPHPETGKIINLEAKLPSDFCKVNNFDEKY